MNIVEMKTPQTRSEFERNINILKEKIMNGKIHFPMGYSAESLLKIRFLPNKRLDFLSVDEMARLQANQLANFDQNINFEKAMNEQKNED